jgi:hypothetical protein
MLTAITSPRMPEAFEAIILLMVVTDQFRAVADEQAGGSSSVR